MEINDWYDFLINTTWFMMILLIGAPLSVNYIYVAIYGLVKEKKTKYDKDTAIYQLAKNIYELLGMSVFLLSYSIWFLFIENGGNLFRYPREVLRFFSGG